MRRRLMAKDSHLGSLYAAQSQEFRIPEMSRDIRIR